MILFSCGHKLRGKIFLGACRVLVLYGKVVGTTSSEGFQVENYFELYVFTLLPDGGSVLDSCSCALTEFCSFEKKNFSGRRAHD